MFPVFHEQSFISLVRWMDKDFATCSSFCSVHHLLNISRKLLVALLSLWCFQTTLVYRQFARLLTNCLQEYRMVAPTRLLTYLIY